jgi:hypothetical protein
MYVKAKVRECDFNSFSYPEPVEGAECVAPSAVLNWCVVMTAGPEFLADNNIVPLGREEALAAARKESKTTLLAAIANGTAREEIAAMSEAELDAFIEARLCF